MNRLHRLGAAAGSGFIRATGSEWGARRDYQRAAKGKAKLNSMNIKERNNVRKITSVLGMAVLIAISVCLGASTVIAAERTEVAFDYTKLEGHASNQFAVWIEDSSGAYVKTLYAAKFTANGGWRERPNALPDWVKSSRLPDMSKKQVEAISGATPASGRQTYVWDGTDGGGASVKPGKYKVILEASLRDTERVVYSAEVDWGGKAEPLKVERQYFGEATKDRVMIGDVTIRHLK